MSWILAVQDKQAITIAYSDFSRSFDSVSHDKFFARLHQYGIRGQLLGWFKTSSSAIAERSHCRVG